MAARHNLEGRARSHRHAVLSVILCTVKFHHLGIEPIGEGVAILSANQY